MKTANAFSPVIAIDRQAAKPLHKQIYDAYRSMIVGRMLGAGQQVPSSRTLAGELGISRIPILEAYSQLLAEGYFESRTGSGTFVSHDIPDQFTTCENSSTAVDGTRPGTRSVSGRLINDALGQQRPRLPGWGAFGVGQIAIEHFPVEVWSRLLMRHSRSVSIKALNYGDPMGSRAFREAIATYLRTSRAVHCEPDQIMVVSGSQQALQISASVLLQSGSPVWIEEPGYPFLRDALTLAGARLIPVPIDEEGLDVSAGIKCFRKAQAAYVTPSHQYPLGVTMSASRRLQLLDWAQSSGAWIIEDDYDSEFRYGNMPIAALQGLDRHSRVIYIGTFSKTLSPSLRLGYMVIPRDLVARFVAVRHAMDICPPRLFQSTLTDFINQGHFARHIRKTRLIYSERRSALVQALREEVGSSFEIGGSEAGLHLVCLSKQRLPDEEISDRGAGQKLWLWPLSPCYFGKRVRQGFVLGFGSTPAAEMPRAVRRLRKLLRAT